MGFLKQPTFHNVYPDTVCWNYTTYGEFVILGTLIFILNIFVPMRTSYY
jgi:hypothetical protein